MSSGEKYDRFESWLKENGANFDVVSTMQLLVKVPSEALLDSCFGFWFGAGVCVGEGEGLGLGSAGRLFAILFRFSRLAVLAAS